MLADRETSNIPADTTNPFLHKCASPARSRPASAERENIDSMSALREGLGRLDIASTSGIGRKGSVDNEKSREINKRELDRFVPSRPPSLHHSSHSSTTLPTLAIDVTSPDISTADQSISQADISTASASASLSASLGIPTGQRRILSFLAAPPRASHATSHLDYQRNYLLHSSASVSRGVTTSGPGANGVKKRAPPYIPERVLDAPGFTDDYYLNLIDWSSSNRVAIALSDMTYVWDAETGNVTALGEGTEDQTPITSVSWSADGCYLAVGLDTGAVEIWDVEEGKKMRTMTGHQARIPSLSWFGHTLSSGCRDGSIWHHDVRVARHKVMELSGHTGEVCGLTWRSDGGLLASGGNDNVVNCWDGRIGASVLQSDDGVPKATAKWTKRNHTAAVKALAWCPWQNSLLATGGGSADQHIHFWSSTTGARTNSLKVHSQVTSLKFSPHQKELLSTHGYPDNNISLWTYPGLQKIYDVPAHDARVLCSAISPDGCTVATAASDENLKFWKIWEVAQTQKSKGTESEVGRGKLAAGLR